MVFAMYLLCACIVIETAATNQNCAVKLPKKAVVGSSLLMKKQRMSKILLDTKLHDHAISENHVEDATMAKNKLSPKIENCVFELFQDRTCQNVVSIYGSSEPTITLPKGQNRQIQISSYVHSVKINDEGCKLSAGTSHFSGEDNRKSICGAAGNSCQTWTATERDLEISTQGGCSQHKNENCVFELFQDSTCQDVVSTYNPLTMRDEPTVVTLSKGQNRQLETQRSVHSVKINDEGCKVTVGTSNHWGPDNRKSLCGAASNSCQTLTAAEHAFEMSTQGGCPNQQNGEGNIVCLEKRPDHDYCVFELFTDDKCTNPVASKVYPSEDDVNYAVSINPEHYGSQWGPLYLATEHGESVRSVTINNENCKFTSPTQPSIPPACGGDLECQKCHSFDIAVSTGLEIRSGTCQ